MEGGMEIKPPCDPAIPLLGIYPEESKIEKARYFKNISTMEDKKRNKKKEGTLKILSDSKLTDIADRHLVMSNKDGNAHML